MVISTAFADITVRVFNQVNVVVTVEIKTQLFKLKFSFVFLLFLQILIKICKTINVTNFF